MDSFAELLEKKRAGARKETDAVQGADPFSD